MKHISSSLSGPAAGELNRSVYCASAVLFGNALLVSTGAPAPVMLAFANITGAFALVVPALATVRSVLRNRAR